MEPANEGGAAGTQAKQGKHVSPTEQADLDGKCWYSSSASTEQRTEKALLVHAEPR